MDKVFIVNEIIPKTLLSPEAVIPVAGFTDRIKAIEYATRLEEIAKGYADKIPVSYTVAEIPLNPTDDLMDKGEQPATNVRRVKFYARQGAEDLFKDIDSKKVYVRQPVSKEAGSELYTTVQWLTSSKWTGGYEADSPISEKIAIEVIGGDGKVLFIEHGGCCESRYPFSYEAYRIAAASYKNKVSERKHTYHSHKEWHEWICEGKPDKMYADNWIYGNDNNEYIDIDKKKIGSYLDIPLYVVSTQVTHKPSGKSYTIFELCDKDGEVLEICGYDYETEGEKT